MIPASEVRKTVERDAPALLTKGLKPRQPPSSHLARLAFQIISKLLGDLWRQVQKISLSNLFLQICPLSPITSNFILIHSQEAIPFFFLPTRGHNTENLCRAVSLTGDGSGFNFLTDDLSYFYNFFFWGVAGDILVFLLLESLYPLSFQQGVRESLRCAVFLYTLNNLLFSERGQGTEHTKKTRTCKNPWSFKHIWVWVWKMNWYITPFQKAGKKKKRNKEWSLSVKTLPKAKNGCWAQFAFFLSLQHFCKDSQITWTKPGGWFRLQFLFPNLIKTKTLEEGFPLWGLKFFLIC